MPTSSKKESPVAKAEPVNNIPWDSAFKEENTTLHNLNFHCERDMTTSESNNSEDPKTTEEGGGAPGTGAEIPPQTPVQTSVGACLDH
ncbi:hypothetical protein DUI87_10552 [Hirundo rustica rustica]|uniref:Uncharacterized protein n=1 Tax=Hirundo rustica rustica TaxID=333673 RepID=A0A3M0KIG5_HIRRU|nr:hypothetical protein DUI87_10552 [Hirundo rustica rustica]